MSILNKMLFVVLILFWQQLTFGQIDSTHICKSHFIASQEAKNVHAQMQFRSTEGTENYNVYYHRFNWDIDPAIFFISGDVTTYLTSEKDNLLELVFDLHSDLQVDSVKQRNEHLSYQHSENHVIFIHLKSPLSNGESDSLTIWYKGVPSQSGFGAFGQEMHAEGPAIWTLSEPYGAKDWWPCKQSLNDKIDSIDIFVTVPEGNLVASNGLLMDSIPLPNDKVKFYWSHRYPIPAYLIAIAVTNYKQFSDFVGLENGDSLEILNYVYPQNFNSAQARLDATVDLMELFNELFGEYPFANEKYGHAEFGWPGGMEHQTMSFMGDFGIELQAHELAHQWFGNKVTCGSWQDIWLNEGFATYSVGLVYEATSEQLYWPIWKRSIRNHITSNPAGSVFVNDTTDILRIFDGRLSYAKGAFLLHMMRWKIGDEAFFASIRNYLNDPDLAFNYASTADLIALFEQESGMDLTEFVEDWYYGQGYPSFSAQILNPQFGDSVAITLDQSTSHPSVDFFEMPVPIRLEGPNQEDTVVIFNHIQNAQIEYFTVPFQVLSATIDPDTWLISRNNVTEIEFAVPTFALEKENPQFWLTSNIVHENLEIQSGLNQVSKVSFELFTSDGIRVDAFESNRFPFVKKIHGGLPPGIYFLNWKVDSQFGALKLRKQ